jgi:hypothetical protein
MSRRLLVSLLLTATVALPVYAAQPQEFRSLAVLHGPLTPGSPVRLQLPAAIIAATSNGFADLRLFDDQGQEIPYVIQAQNAPPAPLTFTFRLLSYHRSAQEETIVLEKPASSGAFQEITMVTGGHDFHKAVRIDTSADLITWQVWHSDTIFDFTARLPLRKTTLEIPSTTARYVRLHLQDMEGAAFQGPELNLRYEGLSFQVRGSSVAEFRLEQITGRSGRVEPVYDRLSLTPSATSLDPAGNTVLHLGYVQLPVAELTLRVDNVYYYRQVELWAAESDQDKAYHQVASGVIYKVPGMPASHNTLTVQQAQRPYLRVKIHNGDNPPLRVPRLELAWVRVFLYFIPEASRRYTLYCGNPEIRAPAYELRHLLPTEAGRLQQYPLVTVADLQANPAYRPVREPSRQVETIVLSVVILGLTAGLGLWLYRLLRKLPGP